MKKNSKNSIVIVLKRISRMNKNHKRVSKLKKSKKIILALKRNFKAKKVKLKNR